jgi:hypothetical protein
MPTIILRSTQNTLRSPCYHAGDHPSIRLRSSTITLCSIPLIPRADRSPAFGLEVRALPRPGREEGKRRSEGPRHRHAWANGRIISTSCAERCQHATSPGERAALGVERAGLTVSGDHNVLPGASQLHNDVSRRLELLHFLPIARCVEVTGMHEPSAKRLRGRTVRQAVGSPFQIEGGRGKNPSPPDTRPIVPISRRPPKNSAAPARKIPVSNFSAAGV